MTDGGDSALSHWPVALESVRVWIASHALDAGAAIAVLLGGWLLARVARAAVRKAASQLTTGRSDADVRALPALHVLGEWLFWTILVAAACIALQFVDSSVVSEWSDRLLRYLPNLLAGAAIIAGGYLLGGLLSHLAVRSLAASGAGHARWLAGMTQGIVVVAAVIVGLDQIGLRVTFLIVVVAIGLAALALAMALAFALGASGMVSNLLGARGMRQHYEAGQTVRVAEFEGEILEIGATVLVLATRAGRITIPARIFSETPITLLAPESRDA